ncbi:MAG: cytochrome c biogenesis protein CcdA, partial [Dehalococcoidia bacterium]|nr:cytochrome c biogenesis protein CcdA [Dehalococcoidia bacterium]
SRPLAIVAGVVVILVALRMAAQLRTPLLCRMPVLAPAKASGSRPWRSTLMGSTFAAQCFSCFSGTIISALILYAGTSGSPLTGGLLMLVFSLGLGAMLLLSVFFMTSFAPFTTGLKRIRPYLGLASALFMLGIGVSMILDKEHIFGDLVLRLFGLG